MNEVGTGSIGRDQLDPADVFIFDSGKELFVWVGNDTSSAEQKNALSYAHVCLGPLNFYTYSLCVFLFLFNLLDFHLQKYLKGTKHPFLPVTSYRQSATPDTFYHEMEK